MLVDRHLERKKRLRPGMDCEPRNSDQQLVRGARGNDRREVGRGRAFDDTHAGDRDVVLGRPSRFRADLSAANGFDAVLRRSRWLGLRRDAGFRGQEIEQRLGEDHRREVGLRVMRRTPLGLRQRDHDALDAAPVMGPIQLREIALGGSEVELRCDVDPAANAGREGGLRVGPFDLLSNARQPEGRSERQQGLHVERFGLVGCEQVIGDDAAQAVAEQDRRARRPEAGAPGGLDCALPYVGAAEVGVHVDEETRQHVLVRSSDFVEPRDQVLESFPLRLFVDAAVREHLVGDRQLQIGRRGVGCFGPSRPRSP